MPIEGSDQRLSISRADKRWRAVFAGHLIADSDDALVVREAGHDPVVYFPRGDVSMEYMSRTDKRTHCPLKGDAGYYTLLMDGHWAENGVWTYEQPPEGAGAIAGHLAFDPKLIEVYEIDDETLGGRREAARREVDDVVLHTDAGDGHSQRAHWQSNVAEPD